MKKTRYKIIRKTHKGLEMIKGPKGSRPDVKISIWYEAYRKGRIFGFWHKVGHDADWFDGSIFEHTTKTIDEMVDYLASYNEIYNEDRPYDIIYPPKI